VRILGGASSTCDESALGRLEDGLPAALGGPAAPASARHPDPPQPATGTIVRTVEVPVPVPIHDRANETVQMGVAATLGATLGAAIAAIAARATAARLRRRRPPSGPGLTDITDVVQSRGSPGARGALDLQLSSPRSPMAGRG
jgi:hypothetical protein